MTTRYRYTTCLMFGTDGEADHCELDVTVSYAVTWGRPETPPAYDHGGLPADPDEVDDIRLELINDQPRPWDLGQGWVSEASQEDRIIDRFGDLQPELIAEACEQEAAWAE